MIIAGKYEVLGKLGQGGQGSVYKVRHLGLDEVRALKVQPDHGVGEETVTRFRREGRALARLRHGHIVQVFDLGRDADQYYLEMEYVDGPNLAQHLKANGRPPVLDALEIARQIGDALTYAHAQPYVDSAGVQHTGMVHRDIKPSNILLRDQTPVYALLADFGLVKLGDPGERTTTGTMLGTYKYSAPEQLGLKRGRERVAVDFRADVFAFGLVLYELLEGRQFHAGLEPQEILARVLFEPDALEPEFTVPVLPGLRALLRRMVQRDPENRPAGMRVVLATLDEALSDLRGGDATTVVVKPGRATGGERHTEEELEEQIRSLMAERERRRAQSARGDAQAARARALDAGAVELATPDFETAVRREEEASFALAAGDLTHARELYELTSRLFAEAEARATAARERRAAEDARAGAEAAREAARAAGARLLAAGLWTGAEEREQAAAELLASGAAEAARRAFDGVATAFRAARSGAETERERRRADAEAAAGTAAAAREEAEAAGAAEHAAPGWRLACDAVTEGERQMAAGDDLEAAASFNRARVAFADAARASLNAQAQGAAEGAHRAAEAAESAGARERAAEEYAAARAQLEAATSMLGRGEAATARELFVDAAHAFDGVAALAARRRAEERAEEEARRRAAEERARHLATAEAARTAAAAAAERARSAGAEALAAPQLSAAAERQAEADDALAHDSLVEAAERFAVAATMFEETARAAIHEAGRRRALAAREGAAPARRAAVDAQAARWAPEQASDAERLWQAGEEAVAREAFADAERGFAEAASAFERATLVARERAEEARRQEEEARRREEEARRRRAEEEARQRAEEEARRRAAEERARQLAEVEAARAAAAGAAARARDASAADLAAEALAAATARLEDAETAAGRDALVEAVARFGEARAGFDDAAHVATVEAARRRALEARGAAAEARSSAVGCDAARRAADAWNAAEERWTTAEGALLRGAFDDAAAGFGAAGETFRTASTTARAAAEAARRRQEEEEAQRRAEEERARQLAALEAARRRAAAAHEAAAKARASATATEAARWAADAWRAAEAQWTAAEAALAQEAFDDAAGGFDAGASGFEEAATAARAAEAAERRRMEEEAARRRAEEEARRRAAEEQAKRAAEEEARRRAAEEQAKRAAEEEARRRAAERARQVAAADEARTATMAAAARARDAGAVELAAEALAAATARLAKAEAATRREAFGDAAALFAAAGAAFGEAAQAAAAEAQRRQREEERRQAEVEARRAAEAEARRRAEEEARRRAEEAAGARAEAEAAEETARRRREEEARRAAEEDARRAALDAEATVVLPGGSDAVPDEPTIVAPQARATVPIEAPLPAPPSAERPAIAWWPYAAAAALAVALGLGYALLRSGPEQVATRPLEKPSVGRPETAPEKETEVEREAKLPTTPPPPTFADLAWSAVSPPAGKTVTVKEGTPQRFEAAVAQADTQPGLDLRWLLDGKEVGRGASFEYAPGFGEGGRTRTLEVVATSEGRRLEQTWPVTVVRVDRPPVIASTSPGEGTVTVAAGAAQKFALRASDPDQGDRLTYTWERNGKRVASGEQPELTLRDVADGDEIRVTVTDAEGASAGSRSWKVALKTPPPVEPQPPRIVGQTPSPKGRLAVEEGRAIDFSLKVTAPDPKEKLAYAWFVDGRPVGTAKTLRYEAPSLEERKVAQRVEAEVTDAAGLKSGRVGWDLDVVWTPPAMVRLDPKDRKLTLEPGQTRELRAGPTSATKGELSYEWRLDGRVQPPSPSGTFRLPSDLATGSHAVEVASIDPRGLRSDPLGWTIDVRATPPPTVPPTTPATVAVTPPPTAPPATIVSALPPTTVPSRPPPPTLPPAGTGAITQADVRDWLTRYQSAWERKDAAALVALGITSEDRAREIVSRLQIIRQVRVGNESVSLDGGAASLSFDRVDVDDTGKELRHPRKNCRLEKVGAAVVARGGCL